MLDPISICSGCVEFFENKISRLVITSSFNLSRALDSSGDADEDGNPGDDETNY